MIFESLKILLNNLETHKYNALFGQYDLQWVHTLKSITREEKWTKITDIVLILEV